MEMELEFQFIDFGYLILGVLVVIFTSAGIYLGLFFNPQTTEKMMKKIPLYIRYLIKFYEHHVVYSQLAAKEKEIMATVLDQGGILSKLIKVKIQVGSETKYDIIENILYVNIKEKRSIIEQVLDSINLCIIELTSYKLNTIIDIDYNYNSSTKYYQENAIREVIAIMNKLQITDIDLSLTKEELVATRKIPKNDSKTMIHKIKYSEQKLLHEAASQITKKIIKELEVTKQ